MVNKKQIWNTSLKFFVSSNKYSYDFFASLKIYDQLIKIFNHSSFQIYPQTPFYQLDQYKGFKDKETKKVKILNFDLKAEPYAIFQSKFTSTKYQDTIPLIDYLELKEEESNWSPKLNKHVRLDVFGERNQNKQLTQILRYDQNNYEKQIRNQKINKEYCISLVVDKINQKKNVRDCISALRIQLNEKEHLKGLFNQIEKLISNKRKKEKFQEQKMYAANNHKKEQLLGGSSEQENNSYTRQEDEEQKQNQQQYYFPDQTILNKNKKKILNTQINQPKDIFEKKEVKDESLTNYMKNLGDQIIYQLCEKYQEIKKQNKDKNNQKQQVIIQQQNTNKIQTFQEKNNDYQQSINIQNNQQENIIKQANQPKDIFEKKEIDDESLTKDIKSKGDQTIDQLCEKRQEIKKQNNNNNIPRQQEIIQQQNISNIQTSQKKNIDHQQQINIYYNLQDDVQKINQNYLSKNDDDTSFNDQFNQKQQQYRENNKDFNPIHQNHKIQLQTQYQEKPILTQYFDCQEFALEFIGSQQQFISSMDSFNIFQAQPNQENLKKHLNQQLNIERLSLSSSDIQSSSLTIDLLNSDSINEKIFRAFTYYCNNQQKITDLNLMFNENLSLKNVSSLALSIQMIRFLKSFKLSLPETQNFSEYFETIMSGVQNVTEINEFNLNIEKQSRGKILTGQEGQNIANTIEKFINLQKFTLNLINSTKIKHFSLIAHALQKCKNITELNLYLTSNKLDDSYAQNIADILITCQNINQLQLELCFNYFTLEGVTKIVQALEQCKNLTQLNLHLDFYSLHQVDRVKAIYNLAASLLLCQKITHLTLYL
ncbi:hypothetical protein ABPG72_009312, partial [Tetrahymena utriculariae]